MAVETAPVRPIVTDAASPAAEAIRLRLADAWGELGASWGVAPAIARVHAYLMTRQAPLTEREVREALGLSHRAASLALADAEAWGLVERVAEPRRVGRRGPAGAAYQAIGDHWRWLGRVVAERKVREGDPIIDVLEQTAREVATASAASPADRDLAALREWVATFLVFVRLSDRAVGLVPRLEPRELERALRLLGEVPGRRGPAPRAAPRRPAGRRRPRPRGGRQPPLAKAPAARRADVRGGSHRRSLIGAWPHALEARRDRRRSRQVHSRARAIIAPRCGDPGRPERARTPRQADRQTRSRT